MRMMSVLKQISLPFFPAGKKQSSDPSPAQLGPRGEDIAVSYLRKLGYTILVRNYRQRIGEIDIVADDGGCLVFVEVKTRKNDRYGNPLEAVDIRKQRKLSRIALDYISRHRKEDQNARFDVVAVHLERESGPELEHIKNAFDFCE